MHKRLFDFAQARGLIVPSDTDTDPGEPAPTET